MLRRAVCISALLALSGLLRAGDTASPIRPEPGKNFTIENAALTMIWVAHGTFLISGTLSQGDDTQVTLTRGFWLGQTEVTQSQWQAVMDYVPLPSYFKGSERPVERVSWGSAVIFCDKFTERERAAGRLPEGYEYTLPTEAQWEFACRAGTTGIYAGNVAAMAWYDTTSGEETHPVAQKQSNAWGFYDMHGNVSEWCFDWYGGYPGGCVNDPAGPALGKFHVFRGGSWISSAGVCRSAFRQWSPTNGENSSIGFRLALAPHRVPIQAKKGAGD